MTENLANGYSSESTHRELSNEYQYDRVKLFFKKNCVIVLWTKVVSALEGLTLRLPCPHSIITMLPRPKVLVRAVKSSVHGIVSNALRS